MGACVRIRGFVGTLILGSILASAGPASAAAWHDRFTFSTRFDFEWTVDTGTGETHELAATLQPELEIALPHGMELVAIGRARADFFDRLEPGAPVPHEVSAWSRRGFIGSSAEGELRELYLDASVGPAFLRLGKQQVVWGEADGLKLLDVVNPQQFREFILPAFEDSRIPLWMVNAELPLPLGDTTLQLLWIPDPTHHELPEADALFAIRSERLVLPPPPGIPIAEAQVKRPPKWFEDSDAGLRLSGFAHGIDWTLNYLYQYGDFPVQVRRLPGAPGGAVRFLPEYRRQHVAGGSASTAFGHLTVRSEVALALDRYLPVDDATDRDGIAETADVGWMFGFDWFGFEETFVSLQVFQSWLPGHRSTMLRKSLDTNVTLVVQRDFLNDRLQLELQVIQSWNDRDGLVRPRVAWEWRDDTELSLGADFFYGNGAGVFGQYDSNDRVWVKLRFAR